MPEIIIVKNEAEAGEIYGRCVADLIKAKPDAVLGLATGSSPLAAYQALAKIVRTRPLTFRACVVSRLTNTSGCR